MCFKKMIAKIELIRHKREAVKDLVRRKLKEDLEQAQEKSYDKELKRLAHEYYRRNPEKEPTDL